MSSLLSYYGPKSNLISVEFRSDGESSATEIILEDGKVSALVVGPASYIITVAQQLAWLGATCRSSTYQSRSFLRCAYYCDTIWEHSNPSSNSFKISYNMAPFDEAEIPRSWALLFGSPCVASGYPIDERLKNEIGLQLPIEFLEVEKLYSERLSFQDNNPAGFETYCFINSELSYDLGKMLQELEKPTLPALERQMNRFLNEIGVPSFQEILMEITKRYSKSENKNDQFYSSGNLHRLVPELLDTNPSSIQHSKYNEMSWCDIIKCKIENWTKEEWDWWPFQPPKRALSSGEARLYWTCVRSNSPTFLKKEANLISRRAVRNSDGQKSLRGLQER